MSQKLSKLYIAVMGVMFAGVAGAAVMAPESWGSFEPRKVRMGGFEVMPWLGLSVGHNDNVGSANVNRTSSSFTLLNPNLVIDLPTHGQLYGMKYTGNYARYAGSSIDNYNDHNFGLFADNTWSARLNSMLNADYIEGHDARNALLFHDMELWHATVAKGKLHFGAQDAQVQFELAAGQLSKRYDTNNSLISSGGPVSTLHYNYDKTDLTGTFFYRVAPATQMFVEVGDAKFSYVDAASKRLDSNEQRYMVGAKWIATAKTTGSVKIGKTNKSFDLGLNPSGTSTVWDADVTWLPKTYSRIDASLHQRSGEYGGTGSYILSNDADLRWTHDWTGNVTSALSYGEGSDKFQAANRVDNRQTFALKGTYVFRRWLKSAVEFREIRRNSTDALMNYTQAVTMLTLEGSL